MSKPLQSITFPGLKDPYEVPTKDYVDTKAPGGYGYGGYAIALPADGRVDDEAELDRALEIVYDQMSNTETKLVYWNGYPAAGTSTHGWFAILTKSSTSNGGLLGWSAYDAGTTIRKTKYNNSDKWQPLEIMATQNWTQSWASSKWTWLYTNGSPGSTHGAKSITLSNMSEYNWLMISWRPHTGTPYYYRSFLPLHQTSSLPTNQRVRMETIAGGGYYRHVILTDTGIDVTTASKFDDSGTSSSYCTIMQIYGFK